MAKRAKLIDGILYYSDDLLSDSHHLRIYVPSNVSLQRQLSYAYHNSPVGMQRGRDTAYNSLPRDFYRRNMSKHVRKWVKCCPDCIKFKILNQPHGPMQFRLFKHPFHTLAVDFLKVCLPSLLAINGFNCQLPLLQLLRAVPVPEKTGITTAICNSVFFCNSVFLQYYNVIVAVNF